MSLSPILARRSEGEATPMVILFTDGVGEGNLGIGTTFCCHNQAKMEASLHQCDSPEPSMVVMRRYTNTPYIPLGTSPFLYLDMSILSRSASSTQFPLDQLHLHRLLPFSEAKVVLPHEKREVGPNEGRNLPVHPPGQLGPLLIWKMGQQQEAQRVLRIRPPWTQSHQGRMWMTLTWTQPTEIASHVQTQMRCPYELPTRSMGDGYRLPVD